MYSCEKFSGRTKMEREQSFYPGAMHPSSNQGVGLRLPMHRAALLVGAASSPALKSQVCLNSARSLLLHLNIRWLFPKAHVLRRLRLIVKRKAQCDQCLFLSFSSYH